MAAGDQLKSALGSVIKGQTVRPGRRDAGVEALQNALNSILGTKLKIDGVIGTETINAYYTAVARGDKVVQSITATAGYSLPAAISRKDLDAVVKRVSGAMYSPVSYLELLLKLEPKKVGDFVLLDREGTFVGITQFNKRSYEDVRRELLANRKLLRSYEDLPPFAEFVQMGAGDMARVSLLAAGVYYKLNQSRLAAALGGPVVKYTDEIAYLAHNQGATGAANYLKTGKIPPGQSDAAYRVMAQARSQFV